MTTTIIEDLEHLCAEERVGEGRTHGHGVGRHGDNCADQTVDDHQLTVDPRSIIVSAARCPLRSPRDRPEKPDVRPHGDPRCGWGGYR